MKTFYVIIDTQSKGVEEMKITDVRVRKVEGETRLKGVASITIDEAFAVHELRIIEGNEGLFVAMPSRKAADGTFRDIAHPINVEARKMVEEVVLDAFNNLEE
jgi:stage V sporulation protein G